MDVADDENEVILSIDLPGVRREDLKITLEKGLLTISGERKKASLPEGAAWIRSEAWDGRFVRSLQLPRHVKAEAVSAELKDGVLRLVLPKAEAAKPRQIEIR